MRIFLTLAFALVLTTAVTLPSTVSAQFIDEPDDDDPTTAPIDLPGDGDRNKVAQTSMQFLSVSVDPRSAAMADAVMAQDQGSVAMLYNPATMAFGERVVDVALGRSNWIGDTKYNFGTIAFRPSTGEYGVIGLSVLAVDYGQVQGTIRFNNDQGYIDTGMIEPSALAAGISYARALSNRFSVGGTVKYAMQDLGSAYLGLDETGELGEEAPTSELQEGTPAFDFGVLYRTGFRSLNLAFAARNFASELNYAEKSFELPLTFYLGASLNVADFMNVNSDVHSLQVSVEGVHPRAFSEQLKVGGEYDFMNTLSLRAGYVFPTDMQGINLGAGIHQSLASTQLAVDYGYSDYDFFGAVHRIAVRLSFE